MIAADPLNFMRLPRSPLEIVPPSLSSTDTNMAEIRQLKMEDEFDDSVRVRTSIQSLYQRIIAAFHLLSSSVSDSGDEVARQLPGEVLEDQLGYFQLWAGNNGAHRYVPWAGLPSCEHS